MTIPLEELNRHPGYDVDFRSAGDQDAGTPAVTLRDLQGYDVIVAQRWNKHEGLGIWRQARTPGSRLVYELDDDLYSINAENWAAYNLYRRGDILDAVTHSMEIADLITVTTEHLGQVLAEATGNPNIAVLPNCIPGWVLDITREPRDRPAAGWQGGASHGADLGLVTGPVTRFLRRFPGWDLRLAGTDYRPSFGAAADRKHYGGWTQVNKDPAGFYRGMDYDIALAPLLENTFNLSKSDLKLREHMALGIPVIASDVGPYRDTIRHGETGFLVRREHEWLKYLSELAGDEGLRLKMGAAAREAARAWTIEENWQRWADAYQALFRGTR